MGSNSRLISKMRIRIVPDQNLIYNTKYSNKAKAFTVTSVTFAKSIIKPGLSLRIEQFLVPAAAIRNLRNTHKNKKRKLERKMSDLRH